MSKAKQIAYYYNATLAEDETVFDPDGDVAVPQKDEVLMRRGRRWKVVHVNTEVSTSARGPIPVHRVYLMEA